MARQDTLDLEDKVRLLRALAFQIHRKRAAEEVLGELLEHESKGGRRRAFRAGTDALAESGFMDAMKALGLIGDEAALILEVVFGANDHRLLSNALTHLADYAEAGGQ
ncbi:MAG: hypothetical protein HY055_14720 [Magnetospirillum sp.]|nr:hypothetical protein [Magnetospirillum sp.]